MENTNNHPTQHLEVKTPNNSSNPVKAERVRYSKKYIFFRNWTYVFLGFGLFTFLLNFIVFFMMPSVSSGNNPQVWMGFYSFSWDNPTGCNMSGAGACCVAFNVIWLIGLIVQLIGNKTNGVKLFVPYLKKYSLIFFAVSWFIMILGLTAGPLGTSTSSWMFQANEEAGKARSYSFTGGGIVILIEGILFILVMAVKILWFHIPSENKEKFLNTKIAKRFGSNKNQKKD